MAWLGLLDVRLYLLSGVAAATAAALTSPAAVVVVGLGPALLTVIVSEPERLGVAATGCAAAAAPELRVRLEPAGGELLAGVAVVGMRLDPLWFHISAAVLAVRARPALRL